MKLSVIVPMLNEERVIGTTLDAIARGAPHAELIVVDGGSTDGSIQVASMRAARTLSAPRGRARQMNAGAAAAQGEVFAFVHADTLVPATFGADITVALTNTQVVGGRFDIKLDDASLASSILGKLISLRSRIMRSATGDQVIFVRKDIFAAMGGFREIDLCEDVDFARRLKPRGQIACLRSHVVTSARRWREKGMVRTIITMWVIKSLFLAGVSPSRLQRYYANVR